jgi:transketolase
MTPSDPSATLEASGRSAAPADDAALAKLAQKLRRLCLEATSEAGSGHPTSCMSCAELMAVLFFDEMRWDPGDASGEGADVFVLSKGHAAPVLWAVLKEAGAIADDLASLRRFDSVLEGHPTPRCPWVRVATGSLGQGLSAAAGMAWARKRDDKGGRVFALLGDGEAAEGAVWEAAQFAAFYALDNLVALVDVNGLGQSGPTMFRHDTLPYESRFRAFGWEVAVVDGHDVSRVRRAFEKSRDVVGRPFAIVARTLKGKGVSFLQDRDGWHGKPVKKGEELAKALAELGDTEVRVTVTPRRYPSNAPEPLVPLTLTPEYTRGQQVATREAYGTALAKLARLSRRVVAIDGDTKNSTFAERLKEAAPEQYAEAFIAEQNMVGAALGMAREGKLPFASSFACFLTRAYDFIRMAAYSDPAHLVLCGSHAGVSIGEDGPSQMGLEDLAMMRAVVGSTVFYPCDAVSAERLVEAAARQPGVVYIRTSRPKTPVLYGNEEYFPIGQSKLLRFSLQDQATVAAAGVTVHEALEAADVLGKEGVAIRVVDLYSVKPIDEETLRKAASETRGIVSVEDHSAHGGIGDAVAAAVAGRCRVTILGIREAPRSGRASELMAAHGIDAAAIVKALRELLA